MSQNEAVSKKKQVPACRDYALYLLNRQAHSSGALGQKLLRKGYNAEEVKTVLKDMASLGLVNDLEYARNYFENLKKYRNFGYFGIKKKLMDKKLQKEYIDELLKGLSITDEAAVAQRLLSRNTGKTHQQKGRMLQSRGFRSEVIIKVLKPDQSENSQ